MTPSPDPLEQQLSSLQPTHPSAGLARRLAVDLAAAAPATDLPRARPPRAWVHSVSVWLPWGVAATLAVALFARGDRPVPAHPTTAESASQGPIRESTAKPPAFTPVSSTNTLVGALDEGVVFLDDGRPARRVRYEFLDTVNLRSTSDAHATVDLTFAREEIRFLPIDAL